MNSIVPAKERIDYSESKYINDEGVIMILKVPFDANHYHDWATIINRLKCWIEIPGFRKME